MRQTLIKALRQHAIGHIELHKANIEVYLHNPAGIGEHSDIVEAMEKELNTIAHYEDQLEVLDKYFAD